jgi:hypothetical protein
MSLVSLRRQLPFGVGPNILVSRNSDLPKAELMVADNTRGAKNPVAAIATTPLNRSVRRTPPSTPDIRGHRAYSGHRERPFCGC